MLQCSIQISEIMNFHLTFKLPYNIGFNIDSLLNSVNSALETALKSEKLKQSFFIWNKNLNLL